VSAAVPSFRNQDLHAFVEEYRERHPEDVLTVEEPVGADQDVTALAVELWRQGRFPMLWFRRVEGFGKTPVLTNVFASRHRVARILGTDTSGIHALYRQAVADRMPPRVVSDGPVLAERIDEDVEVASIPMLRHFEQDRAPYLTSAIVLARDEDTGVTNASYHRCMRSAPDTLATSLHSRGHLWHQLQKAQDRGKLLEVAVVIGGHPLFMLAASARVGIDVDEREIAGGLFGEPLEVIATPRYGIGVPATADFVLEGTIDPNEQLAEGPFGEYSGYASARSTNNAIRVETILRRRDPMFLDIVSGHSPDHLNLGRIPRESDMVAKMQERFPNMTALEYPASGTHFHCYASVRPGMAGLPRQLLIALLGLDPYLKLAVVVDDDIDVRDEQEVLWAVATRFQADRDLIVMGGLPGSWLDPSSSGGITARMGVDATRKEGFDAERVSLSEAALDRARAILERGGSVE
jgi:2,5-furandicarboxylate decarboxylase 1